MKTSLEIPMQEVRRRLSMDNPWWQAGRGVEVEERTWPHRSYFRPFFELAQDRTVKRATVLIGPRRVGKTVMLHQFVQKLLDEGIRGIDILFLSLDTPLYSGRSLESLLRLFMETHGHRENTPLWVIFDEIQYFKDWSIHLKSLVDSYPTIRFIASGSAAAALKMKSMESGAGRFTDFFLPPLTFAEFLEFTGKDAALIRPTGADNEIGPEYRCSDIDALNREFVDYVNFGGFPEAVMNPSIRANPSRFLRQDIVDKVLLKDLPSLYGISDTQALNRFFNVLAYNTGDEFNLEALSQHSDINKQKLADYIEYLEAAYLIRRLHRVDENAQRLKRARSFKIHLTNPSMRAALFGILSESDGAMGNVAETAVWSQWLHRQGLDGSLCYARWKEGRKDREVDLVEMDLAHQKPMTAVEVKWSDRILEHPEELAGIGELASKYTLGRRVIATTKTATGIVEFAGAHIFCIPTALFCYSMTKEVVE
jgi:predicted AAA+ superfamily ATPase